MFSFFSYRRDTPPRMATPQPSIAPASTGNLSESVVASIFADGRHPAEYEHVNVAPFEGHLTNVDTPSDVPPSGARGHRVLLTRKAAEDALPGLLGMAVDFKNGWDGHNARQKCGIITRAEIVENRVMVCGFIYGHDFSDVVARLQGFDVYGMSYELVDAHVVDMQRSIWEISRATFTGAAIMLREKAAYRSTSLKLISSSSAEASSVLCAGGGNQ